MTLLMIGTTELLLIGGLALLLFGGKKLPEMMRGLGQGVREFKKGVNSDETQEAGHNQAEEESASQGESNEVTDEHQANDDESSSQQVKDE